MTPSSAYDGHACPFSNPFPFNYVAANLVSRRSEKWLWLINDGVPKKYVFLPSYDVFDKLAVPYWIATFRILTPPPVP